MWGKCRVTAVLHGFSPIRGAIARLALGSVLFAAPAAGTRALPTFRAGENVSRPRRPPATPKTRSPPGDPP